MKLTLVLAIVFCAGLSLAKESHWGSKAAEPASDLSKLPEAGGKGHGELIGVRICIQAAFNKMGASGKAEDMKPLLEMVHPDVLLTAMNGEKVRGKHGI